MLHKHRILPGHMGGTYAADNVVLLSVPDHAEAHRLLWEQYGRWQDKCAWLMLSNQIKHPYSLGAAKGNQNASGKHSMSAEHYPKMRLARLGSPGTFGFLGKHHSPETKEKQRAANKGRPLSLKHRQKLSEARHRYLAAKS